MHTLRPKLEIPNRKLTCLETNQASAEAGRGVARTRGEPENMLNRDTSHKASRVRTIHTIVYWGIEGPAN